MPHVGFRSVVTSIFLALLWSQALAEYNSPDNGRTLGQDVICRIPFDLMINPKTGAAFSVDDAINKKIKTTKDYLRGRYIVADLNTTDDAGNCRGVEEYISPAERLTEFKNLTLLATERETNIFSLQKEKALDLLNAGSRSPDHSLFEVELSDLRNYIQQVHRFAVAPVRKEAVHRGYCVGQTLNFCEVVDGQPKLIYRFVTSASRSTPPSQNYYAPVNYIAGRNWSSDRRYTTSDRERDLRLGGGSARIVPFANGGRPIEMPNFLHFLPEDGYTGERANGIHQIAGGLDSGGTFGAPVSLGCLRLNKYQAKLARWWTPMNAKMFIYFLPDRYHSYGDGATGKRRIGNSGAPVAGSRSNSDQQRPGQDRRPTQGAPNSVESFNLRFAPG